MHNYNKFIIEVSKVIRVHFVENGYDFIFENKLTMAPFISLNTTPLKIIGESGLDRSSGSNRQPSCLVQEIYLFIIGK